MAEENKAEKTEEKSGGGSKTPVMMGVLFTVVLGGLGMGIMMPGSESPKENPPTATAPDEEEVEVDWKRDALEIIPKKTPVQFNLSGSRTMSRGKVDCSISYRTNKPVEVKAFVETNPHLLKQMAREIKYAVMLQNTEYLTSPQGLRNLSRQFKGMALEILFPINEKGLAEGKEDKEKLPADTKIKVTDFDLNVMF